jgi:hypothetical protein
MGIKGIDQGRRPQSAVRAVEPAVAAVPPAIAYTPSAPQVSRETSRCKLQLENTEMHSLLQAGLLCTCTLLYNEKHTPTLSGHQQGTLANSVWRHRRGWQSALSFLQKVMCRMPHAIAGNPRACMHVCVTRYDSQRASRRNQHGPMRRTTGWEDPMALATPYHPTDSPTQSSTSVSRSAQSTTLHREAAEWASTVEFQIFGEIAQRAGQHEVVSSRFSRLTRKNFQESGRRNRGPVGR